MEKGKIALGLIPLIVDKIGPRETERRLILQNVGVSTAQHLVRGIYSSTPGFHIAKIIIDEAKREGIYLKGGEAS
jgi:hypothetical protein